ncbi:hypothetical protein F5Y09DRAFT_345661 [Xylaria sp. FL1042]|nr:hypothetical protein F5Y09DRAFT_345661 [Xylaria sp. FL1042]
MSVPDNLSLGIWESEWARVAIQIDYFNFAIRINKDIYDILGDGGQDYFLKKAAILMKRPMEFFIDDSNEGRLLLANRQDLLCRFPCYIEPWAPKRPARFYPNIPTQEMMANTANPPTIGGDENPLPSPLSDAPIQQSMPVNMNFREASVNMSINHFVQPIGQSPITGAGQNTNVQPHFNVTPPITTPMFPSQPHTMMTPMNMIAYTPSTGNAGPSSGLRKRKLPNDSNPSGQGQED